MHAPSHKPEVPPVVAERYRLVRELARGGMGTVWVARDEKLGREVAVKVMAQELARMSEALQRFEREAKAVAVLRSRHVVEVYDYGVQHGLPFIVMELLEGENLGMRLKRQERLPLRTVGSLLSQICKGLKSAHAAGLVHRDLKPSNIFLARNDDDEEVKLLDFGVVKAMDQLGGSDATQTGVLLGTPQYMSPEQARATKQIDHRSDLWSIAVIVFRMLTGFNPFRGESVGDVVLKICSDALPRISELAPDLPQDLDAFFIKAFSRDRDQRFQSADEFAAAFLAICQAQHPDLPPPSSTLGPGASGAFPPIRAQLDSHPGVAVPPARASGSGMVPFAVTPMSTSLERAVGEATPISTTVGGTQLASQLPQFYRSPLWRPVVVGGAALALCVSGLVTLLWLGSPSVPIVAASFEPTRLVPTPAASPDDAEIESASLGASDGADAGAPPSRPAETGENGRDKKQTPRPGGGTKKGTDSERQPKPTGSTPKWF